jgi:hypothetical protein
MRPSPSMWVSFVSVLLRIKSSYLARGIRNTQPEELDPTQQYSSKKLTEA